MELSVLKPKEFNEEDYLDSIEVEIEDVVFIIGRNGAKEKQAKEFKNRTKFLENLSPEIRKSYNDVVNNILRELMAKYWFLGFRGNLMENGETLEDTFENRVKLLKDYPNLKTVIQNIATQSENFIKPDCETSKNGVDGSLSGESNSNSDQ